MFKDN